ncbi:hypothetical protein [Nonomuraea dietziae]|uniref:hypothetical protein n=1 Tax=Nonomuraea dietziae TaxID=65515 RepID=UPI0031DD0EF1
MRGERDDGRRRHDQKAVRTGVAAQAHGVRGGAGHGAGRGRWPSGCCGPRRSGRRPVFGGFAVLCLAWACYGGWALTRRTPLFALDRVIGGWIAVAATLAADPAHRRAGGGQAGLGWLAGARR